MSAVQRTNMVWSVIVYYVSDNIVYCHSKP